MAESPKKSHAFVLEHPVRSRYLENWTNLRLFIERNFHNPVAIYDLWLGRSECWEVGFKCGKGDDDDEGGFSNVHRRWHMSSWTPEPDWIEQKKEKQKKKKTAKCANRPWTSRYIAHIWYTIQLRAVVYFVCKSRFISSLYFYNLLLIIKIYDRYLGRDAIFSKKITISQFVIICKLLLRTCSTCNFFYNIFNDVIFSKNITISQSNYLEFFIFCRSYNVFKACQQISRSNIILTIEVSHNEWFIFVESKSFWNVMQKLKYFLCIWRLEVENKTAKDKFNDYSYKIGSKLSRPTIVSCFLDYFRYENIFSVQIWDYLCLPFGYRLSFSQIFH